MKTEEDIAANVDGAGGDGNVPDVSMTARCDLEPCPAHKSSLALLPGEFYGDRFDALYRSAAREHLDVVLDGTNVIISLPLLLRHPKSAILKSLAAITNPAPAVCTSMPIQNFTFNDAASTSQDADRDYGDAAKVEAAGLSFLLVHSVSAGNYKVPANAPKVSTGSFCIEELDVVEFDRERRRVRVLLERKGGQAKQDLHILAPSLLSTPQLMKVNRWRATAKFHYHFGLRVPLRMEAAYARIVPRLCRRDWRGSARVTVIDSEDVSFNDRLMLQWLESHDIVHCVSQDSASSTWILSDHGPCLFCISYKIDYIMIIYKFCYVACIIIVITIIIRVRFLTNLEESATCRLCRTWRWSAPL